MATPRQQYTSGEVGPGYAIEGLQETLAMLDNLPKAVVLGGFSKALHEAAMVIQDEVDAKTPIRLDFDNSVVSSSLKESIMHEVTLDSNYRGGFAEIGFGKMGYIANMVEYGHRMIGHRPGLKPLTGPRTPGAMVQPYPFMRPAFFASKDRAIEVFADSLAKTVEQLNSQVA